MTQFEAATTTVSAMREAGLIEDADTAIVEQVLGLAAAVDAEPGNASLWREYRGALGDLRSLGDGNDANFEVLMAELRAPIRDGS